MAKAKYTENGNVKVTMSVEQWEAIVALTSCVRMGNSTVHENAISDLIIDLEGFNQEFYDYLDYVNMVRCFKNPYTEKEKEVEEFNLVLS